MVGRTERPPGSAGASGVWGDRNHHRRRLGRGLSPHAAADALRGAPAGQAGATLVEVLVAAGIISLALAILVISLAVGALGVRSSNRLTTAANLAAVQIETAKAAPYDPAGAYPTVSAPPGYTVTLAVTEIATGLQQITATVSFQGQVLTVVGNYKVDR